MFSTSSSPFNPNRLNLPTLVARFPTHSITTLTNAQAESNAILKAFSSPPLTAPNPNDPFSSLRGFTSPFKILSPTALDKNKPRPSGLKVPSDLTYAKVSERTFLLWSFLALDIKNASRFARHFAWHSFRS